MLYKKRQICSLVSFLVASTPSFAKRVVTTPTPDLPDLSTTLTPQDSLNIIIFKLEKNLEKGPEEEQESIKEELTNIYTQLASNYLEAGEFEKAEDAIEKMLSYNPQNIGARFNLGKVLLLGLDKPKKAKPHIIEAQKQALSQRDSFWYLKVQELEMAFYQRTKRPIEDIVETLSDIYILQILHDPESAEQTLKQLKSITENSPQLNNYLKSRRKDLSDKFPKDFERFYK